MQGTQLLPPGQSLLDYSSPCSHTITFAFLEDRGLLMAVGRARLGDQEEVGSKRSEAGRGQAGYRATWGESPFPSLCWEGTKLGEESQNW